MRSYPVIVASAILLALGSAQVLAQGVEVTAFVGVTVSEDLDSGGNPYAYRVFDVQDGLTYGLEVQISANEGDRFGFLFSRLETAFRQSAGNLFEPSGSSLDVAVEQYQATFSHEWGFAPDRVRPFLSGGLGATHFRPAGGLDGETRFSWSLSGGAKIFATPRLGFRLQGRWAPTWLSARSGSFCDPSGTCYLAVDADLFHQFELTSGLVLRF